MKEDIKILEEIVEIYRSCSVNEEGFDMKVDIGFTKKECEALENLIAGYKQLEEENKELKHITQNYNAYQQKSDNPNTTILIADEKWFINGFFKENFISKSKVKEKIEELKEDEEFYRVFLPPNQKALLCVELDAEDKDGYKATGYFKINYCPMCGRRLAKER